MSSYDPIQYLRSLDPSTHVMHLIHESSVELDGFTAMLVIPRLVGLASLIGPFLLAYEAPVDALVSFE